MSSLTNQREGSECRTTFGTDTCARDRTHLSPTKESSSSKAERNECSRKLILSQIDQWENKIIERIRYKAELARQQLGCFIPKNDQTITNDAQALRKEIRKKKKKNDLVEHDLEQVQISIVHILAELKKLKRTIDVELYTEPNYMIDWNHLIFVREKSNKIMSTLVNEPTTNDDNDEEENRIASNQHRKSSSSESENESNSDDQDHPCQDVNISNNEQLTPSSQSVSKILRSGFRSSYISSTASSQVNTTRPSTTTETEQQNDSLYQILQRMRRQREDDKT